ncbi:hypothetical protein [Azospirillum thermophilum]|uniref:hypothetical protein n=1 Tax=Azospirillum thermophilum TaxID=2202148 RepID=UPI00143DDE75|nr:hypothetical protein [Azospirillum thermophilum]
MRQFRFLLFAVLALLGACGPIYETQYSFIPPNSTEGRMCVGQCQQGRTICRQGCTLEQQACRNDAKTRAMMDYQAYVNRQTAEKKPIKKSPSDFEQTWACGNSSCEERCESDYRGCFSSCGGQVIAQQVCTMFCDQAPRQPVLSPAPPAAAYSPIPQGGAPGMVVAGRSDQSAVTCRKGERVEALWEGEWYPAVVTGGPRGDGRCPIHYEGYSRQDDEAVSPRRLRPRE